MGKNTPSQRHKPKVSVKQALRDKRENLPNKQNSTKKNKIFGDDFHYPSGETAFKVLLSARFCAAVWSHISDCDETFNYWEPLHYLVFGKGLQTWEYSPEYALRSYTYLMVHATPAYIYHRFLQPNPLLIFYFLRCLLGLLCAFVELYFYKAVCKEFGIHIGRLCLMFQLFSPGMFIASTAFLPSSFAMYTFTASCVAWWQLRYGLAVFLTALGSFLGWPFVAILGVPIAYDMLIRKRLFKDFIMWSGISVLAILVPMTIFDSVYYGRLVIAPLNIVKYNVFGGAGPNLYGTEPLSYYLINGFLNFNIIWVFTLLSPLILLIGYVMAPTDKKSSNVPTYLSLSPLFIWLLVFFLQPHKEERFLFPVYLMVCLVGAITVDTLQKILFRILNRLKLINAKHYVDKTIFVVYLTLATVILLGVPRIMALYKNYHAPFDLMMEINRYPVDEQVPDNKVINVCLGKDWHRYPSSFFLPNVNWNVRFIKSEFDGMLPAPYSSGENATSVIHDHFNDQNKEELSLYFDIKACQFLLDLDLGKETALEPIYAKDTKQWQIIKSILFLNSEKSSQIFRAFYIPFISDKFVNYGNFSLLKNKLI